MLEHGGVVAYVHLRQLGVSAHRRQDVVEVVRDASPERADVLHFLGLPWSPIPEPIGIGDPPSAPSLSQNYPNPFNPTTTIAFSIAARGHVELNVYDVGGRLVRTLANEVRPAGAHRVTWDGRDANGEPVASGVYFCRLNAGVFSQTKKMVMLK